MRISVQKIKLVQRSGGGIPFENIPGPRVLLIPKLPKVLKFLTQIGVVQGVGRRREEAESEKGEISPVGYCTIEKRAYICIRFQEQQKASMPGVVSPAGVKPESEKVL